MPARYRDLERSPGSSVRRSGALVLLAATAVGTVAGCGVEREDDAPRPLADVPVSPAATEESAAGDPGQAYADWIDALARHDATEACALQSPELTIELRYEAILADRAELGDPCVTFEALLWEDPEFTGQISDIAVAQVTEEDALLEVHLVDDSPASSDTDEIRQTVRMVYHRAKWRVFSTEDRTGDGGSTDGGPSRWIEAWCDLDVAMSRDEIVALMGAPSGEYTVSDGGEPQLWWAQDQYDFRAYLDPVDPAGSVLELVGDYDALSAEDRALLPCPELRG